MIKKIQELDPPGICAKDLKECLLIQLKRLKIKTKYHKYAIQIIENCFEDFSKKKFKKIIEKLEISENDLKKTIIEVITKLNPKPGGISDQNTNNNNEQIIPDFILLVNENKINIKLNNYKTIKLRMSKKYQDLLIKYSNFGTKKLKKEDKKLVAFVKDKIESAKGFMESLQQRNDTLLKTMKTIANIQKEYFITGDRTKIKPMVLKNVAKIVNLDVSTISRVAYSKYVQTPFGIFLLKSFFSESLTNKEGVEISSIEIKSVLEEIVKNEDKKKPLTDDKLILILKEKGYNIARRTIAKYREQLNISVARLRKEI